MHGLRVELDGWPESPSSPWSVSGRLPGEGSAATGSVAPAGNSDKAKRQGGWRKGSGPNPIKCRAYELKQTVARVRPSVDAAGTLATNKAPAYWIFYITLRINPAE